MVHSGLGGLWSPVAVVGIAKDHPTVLRPYAPYADPPTRRGRGLGAIQQTFLVFQELKIARLAHETALYVNGN